MIDDLDPADYGTIERLDTRTLDPLLGRDWGAGVDRLHVVVVTIATSTGATGHGFTWTPSAGARAIECVLNDDIAPTVRGQYADPRRWGEVARSLRDLGAGGVVALALAGYDLAVWDLLGRATERSVASLIGQRSATCAGYASGINWHYDLAALEEQVTRCVEAGATAFKVKVGSPRSLREDCERLERVRRILGPDRALMVDANQRWTRDEAAVAIRALARFDLHWVEEPLDTRDVEGYETLAKNSPVPIAFGENLHTVREFDRAVRTSGAAIVQPNIARVGGITPFLDIVRLAADGGVRVAPHLLTELSAQLAVTIDASTLVELPDGAMFDELGVLSSPPPIEVSGGVVHVRDRPGLGLDFVEPPADVVDAADVSRRADLPFCFPPLTPTSQEPI